MEKDKKDTRKNKNLEIGKVLRLRPWVKPPQESKTDKTESDKKEK